MNQCIFHVGMPKTGTSSIQEFLYYGLEDSSFCYVNFGEVNGVRGVTTLFCDHPDQHFYHRQLGLSGQALAAYQEQLSQTLSQTLEQAIIRGQTPVLSAERGWRMTQQELQRLRHFMADRHYGVKVVAYLRPWKPWLESSFQERVKLNTDIGGLLLPEYGAMLNYRDRLQTLEQVFGADQVEAYPYHPKTFADGCVVKDFCHRLGIDFDPARRVHPSYAMSRNA